MPEADTMSDGRSGRFAVMDSAAVRNSCVHPGSRASAPSAMISGRSSLDPAAIALL